jgi:hypothetical protein
VEREVDGRPIPETVTLPVTINGRIYPREDVDLWTFDAKTGQTVTCEVMASRIGSPLDSRLELRDPRGRRITENDDAFGKDSLLRFTAPADGTYQLSICDTDFGGLQHYVYRLTVTAGPYIDAIYPLGGRRGEETEFELAGANLPTEPIPVALPAESSQPFRYRTTVSGSSSNEVLVEVDDLPEYREDVALAPEIAPDGIAVPAILNGRILKAGEVDKWTFAAKAGQKYDIDLHASRLGSHLDATLAVLDPSGTQLATADDIGGGQTDAKLTWQAPSDGNYSVAVADRLGSRGGLRYAYRLKIQPLVDAPGFHLALPDNVLSVERGKEIKFKVAVERFGGFSGAIELQLVGLPQDTSVTNTTIAEGKNDVDITLKAAEKAEIQVADVRVTGSAKTGEETITSTATQSVERGEPAIDSLMLATTMPTPFRLRAQFEQKFAGRGTVYVRQYQIERNGFTGSVEISLADRQVRHAQGVSGPTLTVPAGADRFEYPLLLSPFMEIGRTSRTNLMAVGEVTDEQGRSYKVTFTTFDVNEQIITLTDPGRLSVAARQKSIRAQPGTQVPIPVTIDRAQSLDEPVTLSLVTADHIRGTSAAEVVIPSGERSGTLTVQFADGDLGPFNMPLSVRAQMADERGHLLVDEVKIEVAYSR